MPQPQGDQFMRHSGLEEMHSLGMLNDVRRDFGLGARLIRRRTVRPVYACKACKDQSPVQVPMPPQVIEKGIRGPGLLAHGIFTKYLDHGTLYRVQQELARHGVTITRTTLADWVAGAGMILERPRNFSCVKVSKAEFGGGVWLVV